MGHAKRKQNPQARKLLFYRLMHSVRKWWGAISEPSNGCYRMSSLYSQTAFWNCFHRVQLHQPCVTSRSLPTPTSQLHCKDCILQRWFPDLMDLYWRDDLHYVSQPEWWWALVMFCKQITTRNMRYDELVHLTLLGLNGVESYLNLSVFSCATCVQCSFKYHGLKQRVNIH